MSGADETLAIPLPKHEFVAGRLALDFCNSLSRGPGIGPRDRARGPEDFLAWARRHGPVDGALLEQAPGPKALRQLHELRAALFGIFDARSEGCAPAAADLAILNAELAEARAAERLAPAGDGYAVMDGSADALDRLRHAVARDAAELLTGDLRRIKRCPNHECLWLFYDASKNLSRRWCAMDDCGTKDKVRRYRSRDKQY